MGGCVGKFKSVDGANPEESKPTNDIKNGETPIEVKNEDTKINENGEEKVNKEAIIDAVKEVSPENNQSKQETVAEPEKIAEGKKDDGVLKGEVVSA